TKIVVGIEIDERGIRVLADTNLSVAILFVTDTVIADVGYVLSESEFEPEHLSHPSLSGRPNPGEFEIIVMNKDMIWKWFVGRVIDWVFRHIIADNRRTRGDVIDNTIFEYLYVSRGKDHDTSPRRYFPDNI